MSKLPVLGGDVVVKILQTKFDFKIVSQRGSHIKLSRRIDGHTITTIVPNHKTLAHGTLRGILRLAHIDVAEFISAFLDA
ncbi:type II toxin-antitoxin system HicA family toxin [Candidatus Berkelbacteria bacterium]|nr:type II toxin-antitoxin system HicA family toxin [Candidatus Berkelbacteria bacterium]